MVSVTFTRMRAAREEIDTAVDLIFTNGSLVAANLLAWAARDIIRGVAKAKGIITQSDHLELAVKPVSRS